MLLTFPASSGFWLYPWNVYLSRCRCQPSCTTRLYQQGQAPQRLLHRCLGRQNETPKKNATTGRARRPCLIITGVDVFPMLLQAMPRPAEKQNNFHHLVNQHNFTSIIVRPWHLHSWLFFQVKALGFNHVSTMFQHVWHIHESNLWVSCLCHHFKQPKDSEDPIDGSDKLKMAHHLRKTITFIEILDHLQAIFKSYKG